MAYSFKDKIKKTGLTVAEVGALTGGIVLTRKFLDFEVLFPNVDKNNFFIKWQGAVKLIVGAVAAAHVANPWLKLLFIGVSLEGAIRTARQVTMGSTGKAFFEQIGQPQEQLDEQLFEAARAVEGERAGELLQSSAAMAGVINPTDSYPIAVADIINPTDAYPTAVGAWDDGESIDLAMPSTTAVGMIEAGAY